MGVGVAAFTRPLELVVVFSLCIASSAFSQSVEVDPAVLARGASDVVVGTISDVTSRMGTNAAGDRLIYSDLVVDLSETLKGDLRGRVTVTVEGGEVGGLTLAVSDIPTLRRGDRALFFLARTAGGEWMPFGRGSGVMKIDAAGRLNEGPLTLDDARAQIRSAR